MYTYVYLYIYAYTFTCIYIFFCISITKYLYLQTHTHIQKCLYAFCRIIRVSMYLTSIYIIIHVYVSICINIHTLTLIHIYICIYIHTLIHTYTHVLWSWNIFSFLQVRKNYTYKYTCKHVFYIFMNQYLSIYTRIVRSEYLCVSFEYSSTGLSSITFLIFGFLFSCQVFSCIFTIFSLFKYCATTGLPSMTYNFVLLAISMTLISFWPLSFTGAGAEFNYHQICGGYDL